ncbi:MAG: NADH-quinone oxidoreductase subunit NuoB [Oscillospiraceae bacterium]|nr:NADH-quinone oxidoreductase subunit NuoB [Oscillospiraceae bacterium]
MFKKLITESMGKSPWLFHINAGSCNGCDIELVAVLTPRYDAERLGFKLSGSPRQADIVVVTGPVTKQSLPRVLRAISQVPEPRVIVTMGSCPQSGNVFRGSYSIAGPLSKYVDVDVDIAGCAPKPEAIIDGLALAMKILSDKRAAMYKARKVKPAAAEPAASAEAVSEEPVSDVSADPSPDTAVNPEGGAD